MRGQNVVLMQQKNPLARQKSGNKSGSKYIFEDIFTKVKASVSLIDAVQRYGVNLRRQGKSYVALCPFHAEKTPSFTVSPEKGFFYCFGCGTGGDVITFTAKLFRLRPIDAAKKLAADFGIPLPDSKKPSKKTVQQLREIQRRRELERAFKQWADETYLRACCIYRNVTRTLQLGGWEAHLKFPRFVHLLPLLESDLDILQFGSEEEKLQLFLMRSERPWLS